MLSVLTFSTYTVEEFDEDLRGVLRLAGTKGKKMVFMIDESNIQDTAFLERMNTLLANGEVTCLHLLTLTLPGARSLRRR